MEQRREEVQVAFDGGQGRAQFMAGQGQKLLLQTAVPLGQGDVADDDDGVRRVPLVERLPGRDEPAPRVLAREARAPFK